jgi:hypothetical protein
MALVDRNELGPEAQADDGDSDFLVAHVRKHSKKPHGTDRLANCDAGQGHKTTMDVSHTTLQSPLIMKCPGRDVHEFFPAGIELISAAHTCDLRTSPPSAES